MIIFEVFFFAVKLYAYAFKRRVIFILKDVDEVISIRRYIDTIKYNFIPSEEARKNYIGLYEKCRLTS